MGYTILKKLSNAIWFPNPPKDSKAKTQFMWAAEAQINYPRATHDGDDEKMMEGANDGVSFRTAGLARLAANKFKQSLYEKLEPARSISDISGFLGKGSKVICAERKSV